MKILNRQDVKVILKGIGQTPTEVECLCKSISDTNATLYLYETVGNNVYSGYSGIIGSTLSAANTAAWAVARDAVGAYYPK